MDPLVSTSTFPSILFWTTLGGWILSGPRRRSADEVKSDRGTRTLIVVSVGAAIALGFGAADSVDRLAIPSPRGALFTVGLGLMWAGVALGVWSIRSLGRFYRTAVAIQKNHEVITSGPYRFVRHPIYAGALVVMVGAGLALGNWLSLLLCAFVPLPAYLWRIHVEERALEEGLGEKYRRYEEGRARLLPGIW